MFRTLYMVSALLLVVVVHVQYLWSRRSPIAARFPFSRCLAWPYLAVLGFGLVFTVLAFVKGPTQFDGLPGPLFAALFLLIFALVISIYRISAQLLRDMDAEVRRVPKGPDRRLVVRAAAGDWVSASTTRSGCYASRGTSALPARQPAFPAGSCRTVRVHRRH